KEGADMTHPESDVFLPIVILLIVFTAGTIIPIGITWLQSRSGRPGLRRGDPGRRRPRGGGDPVGRARTAGSGGGDRDGADGRAGRPPARRPGRPARPDGAGLVGAEDGAAPASVALNPKAARRSRRRSGVPRRTACRSWWRTAAGSPPGRGRATPAP